MHGTRDPECPNVAQKQKEHVDSLYQPLLKANPESIITVYVTSTGALIGHRTNSRILDTDYSTK